MLDSASSHGQDRILYSADLGPVAQALYERASSLQG
jgi:hypothetical protein